jgi:SAM-dependent methyltransferase
VSAAGKWNERYRSGEGSETTPDDLVIRSAAEFPVPGRALDIACGTGRNAIYLARSGWSVLGVDYSQVAVEMLQQRAQNAGVVVETSIIDLEADGLQIEPQSYDLICMCRYLQRSLFRQIRQGLKIGGIAVAIIALVDEDPDVKPMNPVYVLRPGELVAAFDGCEILNYSENKVPRKRRMAEIAARHQ